MDRERAPAGLSGLLLVADREVLLHGWVPEEVERRPEETGGAEEPEREDDAEAEERRDRQPALDAQADLEQITEEVTMMAVSP